MEEYVKELLKRLFECVNLSIVEDKLPLVKNLLERHAAELLEAIGTSTDIDLIKSKFSNFINKSLSTIETLGLVETQYKAIRKLFLSEINGCLDMLVKKLEMDKSANKKEGK